MRILTAGGAGFTGSHYVRTLISGGYPGFTDVRVTVLDKLSYAGSLANPRATVPWYRENRTWWEPLKAPPREQGLLLTARAASALGAP
jgi:dTDP-D-glucose 4,6-dehydratase